MNPVFRLTTVACVAAAGLFALSTPPFAQEAEEAEPVVTSKIYTIRGVSQSEMRQGTRTNAVRDVLAPDRLLAGRVPERDIDAWSLRDSGDEARCWDNLHESFYCFKEFIRAEDVDCLLHSETSMLVTGTEEDHRRMKWVVDAMSEVSQARVNVVIYRLKDAPVDNPLVAANEVATRAKGARMVGAMAGGLGDPLVLQRTEHTTYVADHNYDVATSAKVAEPEVSTLNTGEEIVVGVVSMPDGRLWMQGWQASTQLNRMRKRETTAGTVELPDVGYRYVPISAEFENGGGVILDGGDGRRFMVTARCDRTVGDHELTCDDGTVLKLLNVAGALRGHGLADAWLMTPNSEEWLGESLLPQVTIEPIEDGPYNDAAIMLADTLYDFGGEFSIVGPYLGLRLPALEEDQPDALKQRHSLLQAIDQRRTRSGTVAVRLTAYQLKDTAALPAGVLLGRPTAADAAELNVLAGKNVMTRTLGSMPNQANDLMDLRLAALVRDYEAMTATEVAVQDPAIGTMVLGSQFRWVARPAPEGRMQLELRAGITVGPAEFEVVNPGDPHSIERSRSALAQLRVVDDLAVGERLAAVSPAAGIDGELIVLVLERLK
ncbi:MAG: hypothetical protein IPK87_07950 [Planctomycetes bacterium]|nr:hypothetical protein [Planctomycetota bacterium]